MAYSSTVVVALLNVFEIASKAQIKIIGTCLSKTTPYINLLPGDDIEYHNSPRLGRPAYHICDWICKKGSYTRNYKYLEIQF